MSEQEKKRARAVEGCGGKQTLSVCGNTPVLSAGSREIGAEAEREVVSQSVLQLFSFSWPPLQP